MTTAIANYLKYVTIGITYLPLGNIAIPLMVGNILFVTSVDLLQFLRKWSMQAPMECPVSIISDFVVMCSSKNIFFWEICSSRLSGRLIDSAVSIAGKSFVGELNLNKDMIVNAIKPPGDPHRVGGGWTDLRIDGFGFKKCRDYGLLLQIEWIGGFRKYYGSLARKFGS